MVEANQDSWAAEETVEKMKSEISSHIQSRLGIGAVVEVKEPFSLPRYEGKAQRVIDLRKKK